ncbi:MAG: DUF4345 domain-containing protein [Bacteroidia bacterium]
MELILQILLGANSIVCLLSGSSLLIRGSRSFLPDVCTPQTTLDNIFRFLSGMYFSMGFLLAWCAFNIKQTFELNYLIGIVIIGAGTGRLYSKIKTGSAEKNKTGPWCWKSFWVAVLLFFNI